MSEEINRLSKQISKDPRVILEDVEGDLGYFLVSGHLSVKESNFKVGVEDESEDGQNTFPNGIPKKYRYVEAVYGGAELRLDIPVEDVPPYVNWHIEYQNGTIGRYKDEDSRIISYQENRPLGMLIFSDRNDRIAADVRFMNEAMEMELYTVRDEIEMDIPMELVSDVSWHLEITWVNWDYKDGRIGCTVGAEVIIE